MSEPTAAAPAAPITPATASTAEAAENQEIDEAAETGTKAKPNDATTASAGAKPKEKAPVEEKKSNKKNLKLKVDGQEIDEEIDFDDEEALIRNLQLAKVAQKRMNEKSVLEKQMGAFLQMLQENPDKAMREIGLDPEDFAVKTLQKKIEDEQKSPEQRELEKLKRELEEHRNKTKRDEDERRNTELSRLQVEQEKKIEDGMIASLERHSLPNQPLVVKKMAEVMLTALENNIDIDPIEAGSIVKKELEEDMKSYVNALPDEALEAFLGKERLVSMRKKQVQAVKKAAETASSVQQTGNSAVNKDEKKSTAKKLNMRDFIRG